MWRSNALRLRRNLSAIPFGRSTVRWTTSSAVEPISEQEFLRAFEGVYGKVNQTHHATVGLAISGGVDSMALATLYNKAQRLNQSLPYCHGIIIDHKARPESTEEANWVAEQLSSKLNMKSTVIPLDWPGTFDFHDTNQFETQARRLRYQALGNECKRRMISSLVVAHHKDDQAETVFMRLIQMRWRSGLQGMRPTDPIPECHGIYGVHHSSDTGKQPYKELERFTLPFPVEKGGVQILRPLLGFAKDRLIKTCEEHGISWAEDKTNADPGLTKRNAIRHVFYNHKLPSALSQDALIALSVQIQNRMGVYEDMANQIFSDLTMTLELRTGSVTLQFPDSSALLGGRPVVTSADIWAARDTACLLLKRIANLISPKERPPIGQLSVAVDNIWPSLRTDDAGPIRNSFSAYGIWFRSEDGFYTSDAESPHHGPSGMEWVLTRQPLKESERTNVTIIVPPETSRPDGAATWQLFDNKYWIQLKNHTTDDFVIRTLTKEDFVKIANEESRFSSPYLQSRYRYMKAALNLLKPADLRFIVPAVFRREKNRANVETLIALPTLGAHIVNSYGAKSARDICEYSVRYKKLDIEPHALLDVVVYGMSLADIRQELDRLAFEARRKRQMLRNARGGGSDVAIKKQPQKFPRPEDQPLSTKILDSK